MKCLWTSLQALGILKPFHGILGTLVLLGFSSLSAPADTTFPSMTPQTANLNCVRPFLCQNVGCHTGMISQHRTLYETFRLMVRRSSAQTFLPLFKRTSGLRPRCRWLSMISCDLSIKLRQDSQQSGLVRSSLASFSLLKIGFTLTVDSVICPPLNVHTSLCPSQASADTALKLRVAVALRRRAHYVYFEFLVLDHETGDSLSRLGCF